MIWSVLFGVFGFRPFEIFLLQTPAPRPPPKSMTSKGSTKSKGSAAPPPKISVIEIMDESDHKPAKPA
jgi:hypothetical protein